jgi:hypothetical protein
MLVMMVGDDGFTTLASGRATSAQGEFENIVAQRNLNLRRRHDFRLRNSRYLLASVS